MFRLGATVLTLWHKEVACGTDGITNCPLHLSLGNKNFSTSHSNEWKFETFVIDKDFMFMGDLLRLNIASHGTALIDDVTLIPGSAVQPSTYAVRFTTTQHEELETRSYDGKEELLVTSSKRDAMGRVMHKFLPFGFICDGVEACNTETLTLDYPDMAKEFYTKENGSYPDAGDVPYTETAWKPDPAGTKDLEGAPGRASR